jgi:hypothetical protein
MSLGVRRGWAPEVFRKAEIGGVNFRFLVALRWPSREFQGKYAHLVWYGNCNSKSVRD